MTKGVIYYTSNRLKPVIKEGCWKQLQKADLPITVNDTPLPTIGALSMFHQILDCLERAQETYVFFAEHDILYHPSHWEFTPPTDDTFYYNVNVWRWDYYSARVITYDHHASVSGLCVNRERAVEFYRNRLAIIYDRGYDTIPTWGNPEWARRMGYEPGKENREGEHAQKGEWRSAFPNIDIRHTRSMTVPKMHFHDFVRPPSGWKEDILDNIPGWDNPKSLVT